MNTNLLMAEIKLKGLSMKEFLVKIQMPRSTWSKKLRGLNEFTLGEIKAITYALSLSKDKIIDIFFAQIVS